MKTMEYVEYLRYYYSNSNLVNLDGKSLMATDLTRYFESSCSALNPDPNQTLREKTDTDLNPFFSYNRIRTQACTRAFNSGKKEQLWRQDHYWGTVCKPGPAINQSQNRQEESSLRHTFSTIEDIAG